MPVEQQGMKWMYLESLLYPFLKMEEPYESDKNQIIEVFLFLEMNN